MRDYIYERELRNLFVKLLGRQTPYIHIGWMYDLAVYIPNKVLIEGFTEKIESRLRMCAYRQRYYRRDHTKRVFTCEKIQEKKHLEWIGHRRSREAVYFHKGKLISYEEYTDKQKELWYGDTTRYLSDKIKKVDRLLEEQGYYKYQEKWFDTITHQVFSYEEKFKEVECIGKECGMYKNYYEVQEEREGTKYHLEKGLHLFEFKSNRDHVHTFLQQLPNYISLFPEYIWLVIGDKKKVPTRLPTWVGVFKQNGKDFELLKRASKMRYGEVNNQVSYGRQKTLAEIASHLRLYYLHFFFGEDIIKDNELDELLSTFKETLDSEMKEYGKNKRRENKK